MHVLAIKLLEVLEFRCSNRLSACCRSGRATVQFRRQSRDAARDAGQRRPRLTAGPDRHHDLWPGRMAAKLGADPKPARRGHVRHVSMQVSDDTDKSTVGKFHGCNMRETRLLQAQRLTAGTGADFHTGQLRQHADPLSDHLASTGGGKHRTLIRGMMPQTTHQREQAHLTQTYQFRGISRSPAGRP
jgi:hypothetical protein